MKNVKQVVVSDEVNKNSMPSLSLHQRKLKYEAARNRILGRSFISKKISKCRERFQKRKGFSKVLETAVLDEGKDNRPYAKVRLFDVEVFGLLDSGASISVMGKDCRALLEQFNLKYTKLSSSLKTADGGSQAVIGFVYIPVTYKNTTKDVLFYLSPHLRQTLYLGVNFF